MELAQHQPVDARAGAASGCNVSGLDGARSFGRACLPTMGLANPNVRRPGKLSAPDFQRRGTGHCRNLSSSYGGVAWLGTTAGQAQGSQLCRPVGDGAVS